MSKEISEAFTAYVNSTHELAPEEGTIEPDPIIAVTGEDKPSDVVEPEPETPAEPEAEPEPETPAEPELPSGNKIEGQD